ncbi:MAG: DUF309 domain-containing protein [Candidatus Poseidoniales archaeon]|nr:MAG: DUF309 domain-containing protein [Candidatus Poseidoniales archaeon]
MGVTCPLSQQEQRWLDAGIIKFNTGKYWHAHEDWEEMWKSLKAREVEQRYVLGIQGLIQMTALMLQYERQKTQGVIKMWSKSTDKIGSPESPLFEMLWCVDVPKLLQDVHPFHSDAIAEEPKWNLNPNAVQM